MGRVGVQDKILHTVTEFCGALSGQYVGRLISFRMGAVGFTAPVLFVEVPIKKGI